jgi:hypothetical protein
MSLDMIPIDVLLGIILAVSIAVSGVQDAMNKGEKVDWLLFWKTIVLAIVSGGLLEAARADVLIQILGTPVLTKLFDKLLNAILNKWKRTQSLVVLTG